MGGVSSERLISIKTGNQVYGAIKDIYDVKKILVSKNIKKLIDILVNAHDIKCSSISYLS